MRCGDCKFWGGTDDMGKPETGDIRTCGVIVHLDVIDDDPLKVPLAFTGDASGYYSALSCRADFGCVMFEPRVTSDQ